MSAVAKIYVNNEADIDELCSYTEDISDIGFDSFDNIGEFVKNPDLVSKLNMIMWDIQDYAERNLYKSDDQLKISDINFITYKQLAYYKQYRVYAFENVKMLEFKERKAIGSREIYIIKHNKTYVHMQDMNTYGNFKLGCDYWMICDKTLKSIRDIFLRCMYICARIQSEKALKRSIDISTLEDDMINILEFLEFNENNVKTIADMYETYKKWGSIIGNDTTGISNIMSSQDINRVYSEKINEYKLKLEAIAGISFDDEKYNIKFIEG